MMTPFEKYMKGLREKWNISKLEIEQQGAANKDGQTLAKLVEDRERRDMQGHHLAYGSTEYKGQPMRLWFTIRI
jgi:hypothetical protein